jgi:hypothetical protein
MGPKVATPSAERLPKLRSCSLKKAIARLRVSVALWSENAFQRGHLQAGADRADEFCAAAFDLQTGSLHRSSATLNTLNNRKRNNLTAMARNRHASQRRLKICRVSEGRKCSRSAIS